jgi:hypothetical protein
MVVKKNKQNELVYTVADGSIALLLVPGYINKRIPVMNAHPSGAWIDSLPPTTIDRYCFADSSSLG